MALKPKAGYEIQNNWRPEVGSLVRAFLKAGFAVRYADNGEERERYTDNLEKGIKANAKWSMKACIDTLTACDESRLGLICPDGSMASVFLVLGNSPGELCADYSARADVEAVCDAHSDKWDGRSQPQVYVPEAEYVYSGDGRSKWTTRNAAIDAGCDYVQPSFKLTAPSIEAYDALPKHPRWQ